MYNEIIWNNESIKLDNMTLFMKNWINAGFVRLGQLFNNQGNPLSMHDLKKCMPLNSNLLIEYFTIRNALPSSCKSMRVRKYRINSSIMCLETLSSKLFLHHQFAKIDGQDVFPIIISSGKIFGMLYLTALKMHD